MPPFVPPSLFYTFLLCNTLIRMANNLKNAFRFGSELRIRTEYSRAHTKTFFTENCSHCSLRIIFYIFHRHRRWTVCEQWTLYCSLLMTCRRICKTHFWRVQNNNFLHIKSQLKSRLALLYSPLYFLLERHSRHQLWFVAPDGIVLNPKRVCNCVAVCAVVRLQLGHVWGRFTVPTILISF